MMIFDSGLFLGPPCSVGVAVQVERNTNIDVYTIMNIRPISRQLRSSVS